MPPPWEGTLQAPLEGYLRRWWLGSSPGITHPVTKTARRIERKAKTKANHDAEAVTLAGAGAGGWQVRCMVQGEDDIGVENSWTVRI